VHLQQQPLAFCKTFISYPDVAAMSEGFPVVSNLIPTPGVAGAC
jgi:hypothetical protein